MSEREHVGMFEDPLSCGRCLGMRSLLLVLLVADAFFIWTGSRG